MSASSAQGRNTQTTRWNENVGNIHGTDRLLQQAIAQWLSPKYEEEFSNYSYGFRENRNAHQVVRQAQVNLNEGYEWIIELDLKKFFDRVNHDKLMGLLAKKITDSEG